MLLSDLTPDELEMLGHSLRMVPGNAVLTGESARRMAATPLAFFTDCPAFKSLWAKVAEAVREREDMADRRTRADAA